MLSLQDAEAIAQKALEIGKLNKLKPLTVGVFDRGGHLICYKKQDGSPLFRYQLVTGKAHGALGFGVDSGKLAEVASTRPAFIQAVFSAVDGKCIPVAGGVLIKTKSGEILGAVAISGDTSENDEACGIEGIRSVGLSCDAISEGKKQVLKSSL